MGLWASPTLLVKQEVISIFVNNRFIRSAYLNHAVMSAFDEMMLSKDSFPLYALFIDLDPSQVDINVHPTKQEIKFEDEKLFMLCTGRR